MLLIYRRDLECFVFMNGNYNNQYQVYIVNNSIYFNLFNAKHAQKVHQYKNNISFILNINLIKYILNSLIISNEIHLSIMHVETALAILSE